MKSGAILFCLIFALVKTAAQDVITPTNHVELFNGKDFSGFTFCMKDNADPLQTWSVTNGVIHCTGKPTGYLRTTQSYSNYNLIVEWRFVKIAPKADNTGILLHIQSPDNVWPQCVQVQGKHGRQGDLFLMSGAECKEHRGMDANTPIPLHLPHQELNLPSPYESPIGEWNSNLTMCSHNSIHTFNMARPLNDATDCTISSGFIGIQSEGAEIEIRRMLLMPQEN